MVDMQLCEGSRPTLSYHQQCYRMHEGLEMSRRDLRWEQAIPDCWKRWQWATDRWHGDVRETRAPALMKGVWVKAAGWRNKRGRMMGNDEVAKATKGQCPSYLQALLEASTKQ